MDAASNNGVDNIRDIRDEVVYTPSSLKYRVYIVDEVHMLSGSAFNALLKTLEEPPSHVVFILATTELHKLPATIVSRCQRFDFRRISTEVLMDRLSYIADKEEIKYESEALRIIAKMAQGGMRDAISLLELCAGTRDVITPDRVVETLGTGGREDLENTVKAISNGNFDAIFSVIDSVVRSSRDILVFWQDLVAFYRDMLVIKTTSNAGKYLDLTETETERLKKTAQLFTKETLIYHCRMLDDAFYTMQKAGTAKRTVAEMTLIKMSDTTLDSSPDAILSRISKLENSLAVGIRIPQGSVADTSLETEAEESDREANVKMAEIIQPVTNTPVPQDALRVLRGWNEISERAASGDMAALAFMRQGRAFTDADGRIHIRFPNDFALSMVNKAPHNENIRAALCLTLQRDIPDSQLVFGVISGEEEEETELDDLNF
jgi:DNA polymerase-3 subunit gamma/tau